MTAKHTHMVTKSGLSDAHTSGMKRAPDFPSFNAGIARRY